MTEPLKPCPCGSKAELHEDIAMSGKGQFWVQSEAGWVGPIKSEPDDAVDAWNTRLDAYLSSPGNTDPMTIAKYDDELRKARPAPVWREPVFVVKVKHPDEPHMIDAETRTIIGREEFDRCSKIFIKEGWTVLDIQERATTTASDLDPTEQPPQADVQGADQVLSVLPADLFTHQIAWRQALEDHRENASAIGDHVTHCYWSHEIEAFDRTWASLRALAGEEVE